MTVTTAGRVSIIIPCYNAGEHLVEAVESALAQTHGDIEVVIADDGSTDARTLELLDAARWPRTRVIRQANAGPAAARNAAIGIASGEYILPLDADDRIGPRYVEEAIEVLETRPEVGIVYCRAQKFGAEEGPWQLPAYNLREIVIDNVVFVTALFRRQDWEAVGGYNEKLRHGIEDYDFWIRLVSRGREVVQLDACHFYYRVQDRSRTTEFAADRERMARTYADIVRANAPFFLKNMEFIFEHRFGLYEELDRYRRRYGDLEPFLARFPLLRTMFDHSLRLLLGGLRGLQRAKWWMDSVRGRGRGSADARLVDPHRVRPGDMPAAEWTGRACDLSGAHDHGIVHHPGARTILEGYFIGPDDKPAGRFDIVLRSSAGVFVLPATTGLARPDVATYFDNQDLVRAGFRISTEFKGMPPGRYSVEYRTRGSGKVFFSETGKTIEIL